MIALTPGIVRCRESNGMKGVRLNPLKRRLADIFIVAGFKKNDQTRCFCFDGLPLGFVWLMQVRHHNLRCPLFRA